MKGKITTALILSAALLIGACAESSRPTPSGKGTLRALNASVTAPDIGFLLEERSLSLAPFKSATAAAPFDNFDYTVNFDYQFAGDTTATRLASIPFTMTEDVDHLFIFNGTLSAPSTLLWTRPVRAWAGTETVFEITFGHLSPQLASVETEVDIYFAAPGTAPLVGAARATLGNEDKSVVVELPAGDYELIITRKDDPSVRLFTSTVGTYAGGTNYLVALFDNDPSTISPIEVRIISPTGTSLTWPDVAALPELRLFNGSFGSTDLDLYRDMDFVAPVISGAAFGVITPSSAVAAAEATYTYTEAGNVGNILLEEDFALPGGRRSTRLAYGPPATMLTTLLADDLRNVEDITKLRLIQLSSNQTPVDIYLVENGVDIADALPRFFSVPRGNSTGYINVVELSFQLYATVANAKTILAGPFDFDAVKGDVIHFALIDTADPNVLQWVKYDHTSMPTP